MIIIFEFIMSFILGGTFVYYRKRIYNFIYLSWINILCFCIYRHRIRKMERYIRKRGWYNPILKSENPNYPEDWSSIEIWSHTEDKNPPYNKLGYDLYSAYIKEKKKHK